MSLSVDMGMGLEIPKVPSALTKVLASFPT